MHVKITVFTLVLLLGCVWIRRRSFHVPWYRAVTVSVILQAVAFVLVTPELADRTGAGPWLFSVSGVPHMRDYMGHLAFLAALTTLSWGLLSRLVSDDRCEEIMRRLELPVAAVATVMFFALTSSSALRTDVPNFTDLDIDGWLIAYWVLYGAVVIYLLAFVIRLLFVLRTDPPSRIPADVFIAAALVGIAEMGLLVVEAISHFWTTEWLLCLLPVATVLALVGAYLGWLRTPPPRLGSLADPGPGASFDSSQVSRFLAKHGGRRAAGRNGLSAAA